MDEMTKKFTNDQESFDVLLDAGLLAAQAVAPEVRAVYVHGVAVGALSVATVVGLCSDADAEQLSARLHRHLFTEQKS